MTQEVITRRNLPHWFVPGAAHFVTFRLAGTMPVGVVLDLRAKHEAELKRLVEEGNTSPRSREQAHKQAFARFDRYLDLHREIDWLSEPIVAAVVRSTLYYHNGGKYHLLAWSIMPNHVHLLMHPIDHVSDLRVQENAGEERADSYSPLANIMHSLKSYTAHQANKCLGRTGAFWQHESYDHWVRDEDELERIVNYIAYNPVKAGLVERPQDWYFGSAHDCFLRDGIVCGWLPTEGTLVS